MKNVIYEYDFSKIIVSKMTLNKTKIFKLYQGI